jgi:enoyl-CoA hydratase/carnithine racemase
VGIQYEVRDHIGRITIDNPHRANVLDRPSARELADAWTAAWEDRDVHVVLLTATGDRHFCAGHNLVPPDGVTAEDREYLRLERAIWPPAGTVHGTRTGVDGRMGDHYPRIWKPVVAAVNGWAAGAGLYLLLASTDVRIACREHARFKFALLSQGWLGTGPGATLLARQLRYADAMRILLTDDPLDADEALRVGLINEVVPHDELMDSAESTAARIAKMPPLALRMMKEFVVRYREAPEDEAWHVQHLINTMLLQLSTDAEEGPRAFNERREPNFTGGLRRRGEPFPPLSDEDRRRLDEIRRSGEY